MPTMMEKAIRFCQCIFMGLMFVMDLVGNQDTKWYGVEEEIPAHGGRFDLEVTALDLI